MSILVSVIAKLDIIYHYALWAPVLVVVIVLGIYIYILFSLPFPSFLYNTFARLRCKKSVIQATLHWEGII